MARQLRIQYPGAFYHVTTRGNEKQEIFKSRRDREKFCEYLGSANSRYGAVMHCYCLMNNHYHLLLETPEGNLSQIMRHINGAYTTYFNVKRKRAGHLFQGRFKAILVEADEYALELSRYIHLNPVRAGIVERPDQYEWSSYNIYVEQREVSDWVCCDLIWALSSGNAAKARQSYRAFVERNIERTYENPLVNIVASSMLGSPDFVTDISSQFLSDQTDQRNLSGLKGLVVRPDIVKIIAVVEKQLTNDQTLARQVGMYCCREFSRAGLARIGETFGVSDAGVSVASRRVTRRLKNDARLRDQVKTIAVELGLLNVEI